MIAHSQVVSSSRQITVIKQCGAQLVLGWVTGAWVTLSTMCRGEVRCWVRLSYHVASVHLTGMGTWWNEYWIVNGISYRKCAEFSQGEMTLRNREFQCQRCNLWSLLNSRDIRLWSYIFTFKCFVERVVFIGTLTSMLELQPHHPKLHWWRLTS